MDSEQAMLGTDAEPLSGSLDTSPDTTSAAPAEPKSMDDTIRETLREIQSRNAPGVEEVLKEPAAEPAKGARDANGRFTANAEAKAEPAAAPSEPTAEPANAPPHSWRAEAKQHWGTLPPAVQAEFTKREQDFHKGIEQYKEAASFGSAIQRQIAPFEATLKTLGVSADQAIGNLLAADHRLRYGSPVEKANYWRAVAQQYGVDIGQATAGAEAQPVDAHVSQLQQQVHYLQQQLNQFQSNAEAQTIASLTSDIERFRADPQHGHFDQVADEMTRLLQAGVAKDLHEAYERAVWLNPATRQAMLEQQAKAQREEANQKAQAAKAAASLNVKTRAPVAPAGIPVGQTMEETIRQNYRRLMNG